MTLTADGVDFVETQRASIPALNKLLTPAACKPPARIGVPAGKTVVPRKHLLLRPQNGAHERIGASGDDGGMRDILDAVS